MNKHKTEAQTAAAKLQWALDQLQEGEKPARWLMGDGAAESLRWSKYEIFIPELAGNNYPPNDLYPAFLLYDAIAYISGVITPNLCTLFGSEDTHVTFYIEPVPPFPPPPRQDASHTEVTK